MTRPVRAVVVSAVSVACLAAVISLSGCGATHALLGIHQAPAAQSTAAPLTVEAADKILSRAFSAALRAETSTGAAATAELRTAYLGEGLRAATGRLKLAGAQPVAATTPLLVSHPTVLALSRGFGFPRFIVAQTVAPQGGQPVLHLLISPDAATPYRISMSVEMVNPATVKPFDPLGKGSALVTSGTGLAVAPATLLKQYAAQLRYPAQTINRPPFAPDSFAGQVRSGAAGVAKAVASQATFTQVHKVVPSSVCAVRQSGGDALVFGVIERTDTFAVKAGQRVNTVANKAFVRLSGKKVVTRAASITTLELVVFAVPRLTGPATLVAAREQIVAGSGS